MKSQVSERLMSNVYKEYQASYFYTGKTPSNREIEDLCKKYGLVTPSGTPYTFKNFSKRLHALNLKSVRLFRSNYVVENFELYVSSGQTRAAAVSQIAEELKITRESVNARLRTVGKQTRCHNKTKAIWEPLLDDYKQGFSAQELAKKHSIPVTKLKGLFTFHHIEAPPEFGQKLHLYYRDLTEWNMINAHLYGLIWADGSASSVGQITVALSDKDRNYLRAVSDSLTMDSKGPSLVRVGHSTGRHGGPVSSISIARKSFYSHLVRLGLPKNKHRIGHGFPERVRPDDPLFWHFLRGFFEGDGGFTHNLIQASATFSVNAECRDQLLASLDFYDFKPSWVKDKSIFSVRISGNAPTFLFASYLYQDACASPVMYRKLSTIKRFWAQSRYSAAYPDLFSDLIESRYSTSALERVRHTLRADFRSPRKAGNGRTNWLLNLYKRACRSLSPSKQ
ncbi:hypothetical protein SAMN04487880_3540 [Marinobacter sp. es.042]|uniref:hypothetical protein n=1 Tax=Marinobacter sp. es.042 TaxID=1761794 RepID=UPI000B50E27A|nr:hypothetical protein [Marinobacter sp. es.042]SNB59294.1 hypothetical protein SAMN04487880_3540 [Marinobacter sp. es.042]